MKLKKAQKETLLQWIAEGLETDEINKRAMKFKPRFKVSRSQVDFYRKTRKVDLAQIRKEGEFNSLNSGLALREERVAALQKLADKMIADLLTNDKMWLEMVKGIGGDRNFERVVYYEFNSAEVQQLRGVLDDISAEVGERVRRLEHSGKGGGPIPVSNLPLDLSKLNNDEFEEFKRLFNLTLPANDAGIPARNSIPGK